MSPKDKPLRNTSPMALILIRPSLEVEWEAKLPLQESLRRTLGALNHNGKRRVSNLTETVATIVELTVYASGRTTADPSDNISLQYSRYIQLPSKKSFGEGLRCHVNVEPPFDERLFFIYFKLVAWGDLSAIINANHNGFIGVSIQYRVSLQFQSDIREQ